MSDILTDAQIAALEGILPASFIVSHEALRKQARMGWEAANAFAAAAAAKLAAEEAIVTYARESGVVRIYDSRALEITRVESWSVQSPKSA